MIGTIYIRQQKTAFKGIALIFLLGLLFISSVSGSNGKPFELINSQEAAIPGQPPNHIEAGRDLDAGPSVEVVAPEVGKTYKAPLHVLVKFIPKDGKDIDLSALKVEYLKFWSIDITYRVLPYITKEGIDIPAADLPSGKHKIRLSVADITGAITRVVMVASIK